jgi:CRP/FNR family transcriptional regulator, cyclic AMP receptor protein
MGTTPPASLHGLGWLAFTPPEFSRYVLERCRGVHFDAGENVYMAGEDSTGLFGLQDGGARVELIGESIGPVIAHYMQPGMWFGGNAIVRKERTIGLKATRSSTFAFLPAREIQQIVRDNPDWWREFAKLQSYNMQLSIGSSLDLMIRNPRKRLAATLLRLGGLRHAVNMRTQHPEIDLSQSEIALMANLARNSASKFLHEFGEAGLVGSNYRCIRILSASGLAALVDED